MCSRRLRTPTDLGSGYRPEVLNIKMAFRRLSILGATWQARIIQSREAQQVIARMLSNFCTRAPLSH
jgi:hypothetical protein